MLHNLEQQERKLGRRRSRCSYAVVVVVATVAVAAAVCLSSIVLGDFC